MATSPYQLRKPLLSFADGLAPGTYSLNISNHYSTGIFRGSKSLVLAQFGAGGSKRSSMAIGVIACIVGAMCMCTAIVALGLG